MGIGVLRGEKNRAGGEAYSLFILTGTRNAREILDAASTP